MFQYFFLGQTVILLHSELGMQAFYFDFLINKIIIAANTFTRFFMPMLRMVTRQKLLFVWRSKIP
jgi:hypothetical protein